MNGALNLCSQITDLPYIGNLECRPIKENLANPSTLGKFMSAVKRLKNGKTPEADCLPS